MRIRFAGFGGQGIVLCGFVFGKAAMLDGKHAVHTQSYGSSSRGGLTRSDVCIQEDEIHDLIYEELDALVAMSQEGHDKYLDALQPDGALFLETELVDRAESAPPRTYGLGATDLAAKRFGRRIMANMIMMGFVNEILGAVSADALVRAVRDSVPPGTEEKNESALAEGRRLAAEQLAAANAANEEAE
jgi:2-oxoglutarate ferredoxin oxidoreductase subunit gamma